MELYALSIQHRTPFLHDCASETVGGSTLNRDQCREKHGSVKEEVARDQNESM